MSVTKVIFRCPKCNNSLITYSYNKKKPVCQTCGKPFTDFVKVTV